MCIAIVKPKNVPMPAKKVLRTCFRNNDDGAGFMYVKDGNVIIKKGFMSFRSFWKALQSENIPNNTVTVLHFRIGTSGDISPGLTHPYPITSDINLLTSLEVSCQFAMAHNGIIPIASSGQLNDTCVFIKTILCYIPVSHLMEDTGTIRAIEGLTKGSKMVFLTPDGYTVTGDWIKEGGCLFSNSTYEDTWEDELSWYGFKDSWKYRYLGKSPRVEYTRDNDYSFGSELCDRCKIGEKIWVESGMYQCDTCGEISFIGEDNENINYLGK